MEVLRNCSHPRSEIRRDVKSNGAISYRRQCLDCFQSVGTELKHAEAPKDAPPYDRAARDDYWRQIGEAWQAESERRQQTWQQLRDARRQARYEEMADYYSSIAWARTRTEVLERDDYRCQARLDGICLQRASQVHHLTYAHFRCEPLFDLVSVCRACHEQITQMDRDARDGD